MRRGLLALLALALAPAAHAVPSIGLQSGVPQAVTLPASSFTTSYFIDLDAAPTRLRIELGAAGGQDVDVLLRYGTPFPDLIDGQPPTAEYLFELAHYSSASGTASESIEIGRSNWQPVRAGRWYILLLNFASVEAAATVTATASNAAYGPVPIEVVFDDPFNGCNLAGWNDPAAFAPAGGNPATTLGQARRNAIQEAVRRLGLEVRGPAPLRVQACWNALGGTATSAPIAGAFPEWLFRNSDLPEVLTGGGGSFEFPSNSPWLTRNHTWFPGPPGLHLAGTRFCGLVPTTCAATDIRIEFNLDVDGPTVLGPRGFWYGYETQAGCAGSQCGIDFVSTAMHELTHGLGFYSTINTRASQGPIGARLDDFDDQYAANLSRVQGSPGAYTIEPFLDISDAERAEALVGFSQVRWSGSEAINSPQNANVGQPPPDNFIPIYTPNPIEPGSTLSHVNAQTAPNSLMCFSTSACNSGAAVRQLGIALPILWDMGWTPTPRSAPNFPLPRATQYFDPSRPGHGIDVSRVVDDVYVVIFYTYGASGQPEWYLAIGQVIDGVFVPADNANGDSLVRYKFVAGGNPQQQADPGISGQIRIDFNQGAFAPACRDGVARDSSTPLAVMTWSIGADRNQQWCMQALIPDSLVPATDYTGSWFAGNQDSGWGYSFLSFAAGANDGLFGLLYYPDTNGDGRWAFIQTSNFVSGGNYPLVERRGYCRTCATPPNVQAGQFDDVNAGTLGLTINAASQDPGAGNRSTVNVTYQTAPGGTFTRTNSPLILLSAPPSQ